MQYAVIVREAGSSSDFEGRLRPEWPRRGNAIASRIRRISLREITCVASDPGTDNMVAQARIQRIASTPGVCGGDPCVRGTRIAVWLLEHRRRLNRSVEQIIASFPFLSKEDVQAAFDYASAHKAEIELQIRENTED